MLFHGPGSPGTQPVITIRHGIILTVHTVQHEVLKFYCVSSEFCNRDFCCLCLS